MHSGIQRHGIPLKTIIEQAIESDLYLEIGRYLHCSAHYQLAVRAYETGLALNPNNDTLHCQLGLTHHNLGNHKDAITHYSKATFLNPKNSEAHYYLGFILIQENRIDEASEALRIALNLNPELNPAYHYLSICLERKGQRDNAIQLLKNRLISTYPVLDGSALFTLGDLLSQRRGLSDEGTCHAQILTSKLLNRLGITSIHCFGDSHRSVFNNLNGIVCHNVGAGTAFNLINKTSSTGAGTKILRAVQQLAPKESALLLVFGEIDCMEDIYKNAFRNKGTPEDLIKDLVHRLLDFCDNLCEQGFTVMVYGPAFSGVASNSHGGLNERNRLVELFNRKLGKECSKRERLIFASIDDLIINHNDEEEMLCLSKDGRHLDHFPTGSPVMQGIILSRFLIEANRIRPNKRKRSLQHETNWRHSVAKPFLVMTKNRRDSIENMDTLINRESLNLALTDQSEEETGLILDLLDHVAIDSVVLELCDVAGVDDSALPTGMARLTTFAHDNISNCGQFEIRPKPGKWTFRLEIPQTVARSVMAQITWNHNSQQNSIPIKLKSFEVYGPYHGLCRTDDNQCTT